MTSLPQAIRDAIEALKTPAPREIIAEQLQRALDAEPSQQMTASNPFPLLQALSARLQDPASRRPEYAASLLSSVREELKEILDERPQPGTREPDAREALRELVERIDVIHNDPQFKSVWMMNQLHAGPYGGPTYVKELEKARAALRQPAAAADTPGGDRERIAFELWQRFAPVHHIGWKDETHKAEYYAAADAVLAALPPPPPSDERARAQPRVSDNDAGEITVALNGKELRGWSYADDAERRTKMLCAREYVEGWCDGRTA